MEEKKRNELEELGEFGLIDRISQGFVNRQASTRVGIGDDAANCVCYTSDSLLVPQ